MKHAERITSEPKRLALSLEIATLDGDPRECLPAAIAQVWSPVLRSGLGVLPAHRIDCPGVQPELFAASDCQAVEVKPSRPRFIPSECVLLAIVAIVPNILHRSALLIQQTSKRLHAIAVNCEHCISIQASRFVRDNNSDSLRLEIG